MKADQSSVEELKDNSFQAEVMMRRRGLVSFKE